MRRCRIHGLAINGMKGKILSSRLAIISKIWAIKEVGDQIDEDDGVEEHDDGSENQEQQGSQQEKLMLSAKFNKSKVMKKMMQKKVLMRKMVPSMETYQPTTKETLRSIRRSQATKELSTCREYPIHGSKLSQKAASTLPSIKDLPSPGKRLARSNRVKKGGSKRICFREGWIQFSDKRIAKVTALSLNGQKTVQKKGSFYSEDLWNLKYLPKLTERLAHEQRMKKKRLRLELDQERKVHEYYAGQVQESKTIRGIIKKKEDKEQSEGESRQKPRKFRQTAALRENDDRE